MPSQTNSLQKALSDPYMGLDLTLPLWVRVDLRVMAMMWYLTVSRIRTSPSDAVECPGE